MGGGSSLFDLFTGGVLRSCACLTFFLYQFLSIFFRKRRLPLASLASQRSHGLLLCPAAGAESKRKSALGSGCAWRESHFCVRRRLRRTWCLWLHVVVFVTSPGEQLALF